MKLKIFLLDLLRFKCLKIDKQIFSLVFLFLLSFLFRSYKVMDTLNWTGDTARDIFIAKRYVEYMGDEKIVRPYAAGGRDEIINSPFYYLFLAFLWFLTPNVYGILLVTAFVNSLANLFFYFLLKRLTNKNLAIWLTFLITFSSFFIDISRQLWQPNFLISLTIFTSYFFYIGIKGKNVFFLLSSILFSFLMSHLHLSAIFFTMTVCLLNTIFLLKEFFHLKNKIIFLKLFLTMIFIFSNFFFLRLMTKPVNSDGYNLFFDSILDLELGEILLRASNIYKILIELLLPTNYFSNSLKILIPAVLILVNFFCINKKSKPEIYLLILYIFPLLFVLTAPVNYENHYFYPEAICLLFLIIIGWTRIANDFFKIFTYLFLSAWMIYPSLFILENNFRQEYEIDKRVANFVFQDLQATNPVNERTTIMNFNIFVSDTGKCFDFFSHSYWYFLEEKMGKRLIPLEIFGNNLEENQIAEYGYLICEGRIINEEQCLKRFSPPYQPQIVQRLKKIDLQDGKIISLYKFKWDLNYPLECRF